MEARAKNGVRSKAWRRGPRPPKGRCANRRSSTVWMRWQAWAPHLQLPSACVGSRQLHPELPSAAPGRLGLLHLIDCGASGFARAATRVDVLTGRFARLALRRRHGRLFSASLATFSGRKAGRASGGHPGPTRGPGPSSHPRSTATSECNNNPARARRACRRSRYARRRSRIGSIGARMTPRASRARSPSPSDRRRQFACFGGHTLLEATGLRRQWAIPQRGM